MVGKSVLGNKQKYFVAVALTWLSMDPKKNGESAKLGSN